MLAEQEYDSIKNDSNSIDKSVLRAYLQTKLPEYMIPGYFVELDQVPLTPNGKIDRKAFPSVSGEDIIRKEYVSPRNETEEKLVEIWQEVLGVDKIGITDNFFELGGHSLMVAQVLNRIYQNLAKQVSFKDFFTSPTIEGITKNLTGKEFSPIPKVPQQDSYPLTPSQQRLWVLSQLEGGSQAYNMPAVVTLRGKLNEVYFEKAFQYLIDRHEILRTSFKSDKTTGEIRQYILPKEEVEFSIETLDFRDKEDADIEDYLQSANNEAFNLDESPLIRASLLRRGTEENLFFLSMHHLIGDGWSIEVLVSEVVEAYNKLLKDSNNAEDVSASHSSGEQKAVLPLAIQYKDYSVWLHEEIKKEKYQIAEAYWLDQFGGELPVLDLPSYKTRPLIQTYNGNNLSHVFTQEFTGKLKSYSEKHGVTLFMTLMAGVKTLLYRYTGQLDIIIGTPIAGREHPDLENQIGLYLNTLAIRTTLEEERNTFESVLIKEKETLLSAYEHQCYPFDELVNKLNIKRDTSRSALFDVLVVFQNQSQLQFGNLQNNIEGLQVDGYDYHRKTSQFDVSYAFAEENERLGLTIDYNTDIYDEFLIQRMITHFENLLTAVVDDATREIIIEDIDYLTDAERHELLVEFNDTKVDYPSDKTIIELFEEQVKKTPEKVAVVFDKTELTYSRLNEEANQLGDYLRQNYHIEPDDLVAIKLERSEKMIVAILGILKSGAAYVPIDPEYPQERIEYIEQDTNAKLTIDEAFLERFQEELKKQETQYKKENLPIISRPDSLAYVIYTSGTTGQPKGVMIENKSLSSYILGFTAYFKIQCIDVMLCQATIAFDTSIEEIFPILVVGGKLVIAAVNKDFHNLARICEEETVTILSTNPYIIEYFDVNFDNLGKLKLKTFISGGDKLQSKQISNLLNKVNIYNTYGPTESTVCCSYYNVTKEFNTIPIGRPISNTSIYILDEDLQVVPIGVSGTLYVSGVGLSRGYLNKPELTSEKFIPNPFIEGSRMYDTGDLARWLPDGNIEFLGRKDFQVKIRGYRIELGEIETSISQFSTTIKQVVADVKEINGEKILVAYYTISDSNSIDKSVLRAYLQTKLPEYMIPGYFVELDQVPLTPNGKIDRKAFPSVSGEDIIRKEYVSPRNETEGKLVEIWQEVLGVDKIGITDNFFELGGHSLMVAQVLNRIYQNLAKQVSFKDFFTSPTIEGITKNLTGKEFSPIPKVPQQDSYPLTPSQQRLWVLSQLEGGSQAYNMPAVVTLRGKLNEVYFEKAFQYLIDRHEILRTSFKSDKTTGEIRQYILPKEEVEFSIETLDFRDKEDADIEDYLQSANNEAFNLDESPLIRASLLRRGTEENLFFLSMHHLIGDGWSIEVLVSEVVEAYNKLLKDSNNAEDVSASHSSGEQKAVLPLAIQYKDYSVWLHEEIKKEKYQIAEAYWLDQFGGELPVLDLPSYKTRPLIQTYNGNNLSHVFTQEFTGKLKSYSEKHGVTLFMTLMAGVKTLLYRYTGQLDIIIGTPIAGREHPDLENQIGLYLNTLAIRTTLEEERNTFESVLIKEKETLLSAYEHQCYPFDELVNKLNIKRDTSRSALFDVLVVFQNQSQLQFGNLQNNIEGLQVDGYDYHRKTSQFDVSYAFAEENERLGLTIDYNTDIYDEFLIQRMITHFENLLTAVVDDATREIIIEDIDYLTDAERHELLVEFNDTKVDYPSDKTIIELFEEQVKKTPEKVAVVFDKTELTYSRLNEEANQLGDYLRQNYHIEPDDLVAIKLERSEKMIVAILGILKSGAAYVPIDPEYPQERIEYIEQDTNAKLTIDEAFLERFQEELKKQETQYKKENLPIISRPDSLAYVIYTSGTTGQPKGVMMQQKNILNLIIYHINTIHPYSRVTFLSNPSFDVSFQEIFSTLLAGATLFPLSDVIKKDIYKLSAFITINQLDSLFFPTAYFKILIENSVFLEALNAQIRHIIVAGEKLTLNDAIFDKVREKSIKIHNHYGPAETHVVTTFVIDRNTAPMYIPPIGKPIANTSIYILNKAKGLCTVGEVGRVYIGGNTLAKGYKNKDELTKERFIQNPFVKNSTIYDTGDLARWLPDGNIEYFGRKDFQVKIRGYRIEINEIEIALAAHEDIETVVVQVREINGENALIAYYIPKNKSINISKKVLREYIQLKLPDYMIPGYFVELDTLPLTSNGKVDRKALPSVTNEDVIRKEYVAPRNEQEEKVTHVWKDILGIEQVSINDNFFELGGNSIKAILFIAKLNSLYRLNVGIRTLFENPQIDLLVPHLIETQDDFSTVETTDLAELSPQQMSMWISEIKNSTSNIIVGGIKISSTFDAIKFKSVLDNIVRRHKAFRTTFVNEDNHPMQKVVTQGYEKYNIEIISEEDLRKAKDEHKFVLEEYPLFKIYVLIQESGFDVFLKIHHLIFDGWSLNLFRNELLSLYTNDNEDLSDIRFQYTDYVNRLKNRNKTEIYNYWETKLKNAPEFLTLPEKIRSSAVEISNHGEYTEIVVDHKLLTEIKTYIQESGVTLSTFIFTCIKVVLSRISNSNRIIIAIPSANRNDYSFANTIGLFTNILFHYDEIKDNSSFVDFMQEIHTTSIDLVKYSDTSLHEICDALKIKNSYRSIPLTPVVVNILDFLEENYEAEVEQEILVETKFDIEFFVDQISKGMLISAIFKTDLYEKEEVEYWLKGIISVIKQVLHKPEIKIEAIDIFDEFLCKDDPKPSNGYTSWDLSYDSIIDRFQDMCESYPDKLAIVEEHRSISYHQLNEMTDKLALHVCKRSKNDKILLLLSHGYSAIVGIFAVLKSGKAYIPIDLNLNQTRINEIIEEINTDTILCDRKTEQLAHTISKDFPVHIINIEEFVEEVGRIDPVADSLAYILYTSGSTGKPKGVMQSHKNVLHFINVYTSQLHISVTDRISLIPFYNFDSAVMDIFGALLNGATLYPYNVNESGIYNLPQWLNNNKISIYHSVPTLYRSLTKIIKEKIKSVRLIVLGGEAVFNNDLLNFKKCFGSHAILINGYGPTESTIVCQKFLNHTSSTKYNVPIGTSVKNTTTYLVKANKQIAHIYEEGEIVYVSDYLALGYYKDDILTNQKFRNELSFLPEQPTGRCYYSGDLGKLLPNGDIEFIGRIDNQIKLNGIRIELNEVSCVAEKIEGVNTAITLVRKLNNTDYIVCYLVINSNVTLTCEMIVDQLKITLPSYMVPKAIILLEKIPLTNTGKVNAGALPQLEEKHFFKKKYIAPESDVEEKVKQIWENVLDISQISTLDNFFDIGGTSLKAIELMNKLKTVFTEIKISAVIVFEYTNIKEMAKYISNNIITDSELVACNDDNIETLLDTIKLFNDNIKE